MAESYDAIVIGAGHNGLVCAAYLARAGPQDARPRAPRRAGRRLRDRGGLARLPRLDRVLRHEPPPAQDHPRARAQEVRLRGPADRSTSSCPSPTGGTSSTGTTPRRPAPRSPSSPGRTPRPTRSSRHFLHDAAKFVRELLWKTPPNPASRRPADIKEMIGLLWQFRKLGNRLFRFVDLMTESISDFLDRYFESDQLKAVLAYYGSIGTFAGPRTPGTAYVLLHHLMGEHEGAGGWGFIRGGMGGISLAIARSAERHGARVRADAEVARITVRDGRAAGVVLASGEEIAARIVVSNADPRRTFLGMLGEGELPAEFVDEVRTYKTYSTAFKINLALDEAPAVHGVRRQGDRDRLPDLRPHRPQHRVPGARLRRRQVRSAVGPALPLAGRAHDRRPGPRAEGQAHPQHLRRARALHAPGQRPGIRSASASPTPSSTRWPSTRRTSRAR